MAQKTGRCAATSLVVFCCFSLLYIHCIQAAKNSINIRRVINVAIFHAWNSEYTYQSSICLNDLLNLKTYVQLLWWQLIISIYFNRISISFLQFEQHTSFQDCYDPLIGIGPTPHLPFDQISSSLLNPTSNNQVSYLQGSSGAQGVDDYHQINNLLNNNSCKGISILNNLILNKK